MARLTDAGKKALDDLANTIIEGKTIPGFVMGATSADEELYFQGGGYKVVNDRTSGQVDGDTVFWVCSMTKMITHIAALQLIEQGKLATDTPVSKFFPQFFNTVILSDITSPTSSYIPAKTAITVQHLLNFSSGLFYPIIPRAGSRMPDPYSAPHDLKDPHGNFLALLQGDLPGIPLKFEPGTDFVYGYSSDILGFIVEKITGTTLESYFQENIFKPLGIKGSFYLTQDLKERMLTLTRRTEEGKFEPRQEHDIMEQNHIKVSRHMGGVGLYTTLKDYLTLLRHILQVRAGKATNPILKLESVRSMFVGASTEAGIKNLDLFTVSAPTKGNSWSTALAVSSVDAPKRRKKGSAFWSGWAGTYFFMDPTTGLAGIFGTQLTGIASGSRDPENLKAFTAFEETLYAGLA
ncbi:beta-lactamase/transpeptidase-like protein [Pholiota conissans]|uniref:Beta-lactamase/transpeptidase-like protein n=1 Tax=Pholiota conissans TaxID=109636 RepID=A0A9P6D4A7_9AGAR|nr:beta-lactamase/transpeptidase-like protein [Pholiota conissans]